MDREIEVHIADAPAAARTAGPWASSWGSQCGMPRQLRRAQLRVIGGDGGPTL
jgi:hypothetical protein